MMVIKAAHFWQFRPAKCAPYHVRDSGGFQSKADHAGSDDNSHHLSAHVRVDIHIVNDSQKRQGNSSQQTGHSQRNFLPNKRKNAQEKIIIVRMAGLIGKSLSVSHANHHIVRTTYNILCFKLQIKKGLEKNMKLRWLDTRQAAGIKHRRCLRMIPVWKKQHRMNMSHQTGRRHVPQHACLRNLRKGKEYRGMLESHRLRSLFRNRPSRLQQAYRIPRPFCAAGRRHPAPDRA